MSWNSGYGGGDDIYSDFLGVDLIETRTYTDDLGNIIPGRRMIGSSADAGPPVVTRPLVQPGFLIPQFNNAYGRIASYPLTNAQVGAGDNEVPVILWAVDLQADPNVDFTTIARHVFGVAYRAVSARVRGHVRNENDFCQMRLLRVGDLVWDVTTEMESVRTVVNDFLNAYYLWLQSGREGDIRTLHSADATGWTVYQFRFTFVLQTSRENRVDETNIGELVRFGNTAASNRVNQRTNIIAVRNRYLNQVQSGFSRADLEPQLNNGRPSFPEEQINVLRQIQQFNRRDNQPAYRKATSANRKQARREEQQVNTVAQQPIAATAPVANAEPRKRKPWTAEQKARYNQNKRDKRSRTKGIYEDLKRKIFHHCSLDEYFLHSKAIIRVPNTWSEGYCLAMAFLKSECRTYLTNGTSVVESEVAPLASSLEVGDVRFPISDNYHQLRGQNCDFIDGEDIVLFNPYKYKNREVGEYKYAMQPPDDIIRLWYQSAQCLHDYVSYQIDTELDENSEFTLQAYADVFDVHIAVYSLEVQSKRTCVIRPRSAPIDLRKVNSFKVVSLLIADEHCSAVSSLREYVRTKSTANRTSLLNYCVLCEKSATANNETKEESIKHFNQCIEKKDGRLCCDGDKQNRRKLVKDVVPEQFTLRKKDHTWHCKLCLQELVGGLDGQMEHVCFINKPDQLKMGQSELVYVYDLECAQLKEEGKQVFIHEVNLICVRRAYPDANGDCDRHSFETMKDFIEYVMSNQSQARVYLAHNGSKYDAQFIVKYFEKNLIAHTFVPSPSSMHAYLSVTVSFGAKASATFIDFRHFVPGSLKNIGVSFGLSVTKGDFPHHFNNGFNDFYEGSLPVLNHPSDYWCIQSKRSQEDIDEFVNWYHAQQTIFCTCDFVCQCEKRKWNFKEQLLMYCWLDVDVLAEACMKYRDNALAFGVEEESNEGWVSKGIDPFQYLTIPQLALNLLLAGAPEEEKITITLPKNRRDRVPLALAWLERRQRDLGKEILHIGNHHREYFCPKTKRFLDGYSRDHHVFVCLDCDFHGCSQCFYEEMETGTDHPSRPGTYGTINQDTQRYVTELLKYYGHSKVEIVWKHDLVDYTVYEKELGNIMKERDMFYGGRTEVFSPYVNAELYPLDDIQYHDVCSLYPYVCAFKPLPTGHPEHLFYNKIDRARLLDLNHPNRYFGYVRCHVIPNTKDILGLLPYRDPSSGRLEFPLNPMTGCWGTEELTLALENGYIIEDIYEVYHWTPEERSDTLLRGYVSFFLRMKQEAEGWKKMGASSETPSEEEQYLVQQRVYEQSGCIARIRVDRVAKNPVKRQMAKLFLNSLWGKFCQKPHSESYVVIHGYQEFAALWYDPNLDRSKFSFRHISGNTWKVKMVHLADFTRPNAKYNIFLSSKVTEWARCILHRQMIKIGPRRVLYCDTDSIMFLWPKANPRLESVGLGKWVNEYPDQQIKRLYALAPKFYYLEFEDDCLLKSKGIQMSMENNAKINGPSLGKQLLELFFPRLDVHGVKVPFQGYLPMKNMLMGINSTSPNYEYGTMMTKFTEDKKLGPVFSKRQFVSFCLHYEQMYDCATELDRLQRIVTIPKGYYETVENVANHVYAYLK